MTAKIETKNDVIKDLNRQLFAKMRPTTVSHPGHAHGHVAIAALRAWGQVKKTGVEALAEDASVIGLLKK